MSEFRKWIDKLMMHGLEFFGLFYGAYEGEVFDVDDPEGLGRIRAKCYALWPHGVDPPDYWCWPAYGICHKEKAGWWWPLQVGDPVRIQCRMGNPSHPIYSHGWWGSNDIPEGATAERRFLRTPAGFEIVIDDEEGTLTLSMPDKKARLEMKGDGLVNIWSGEDKGWASMLVDGSFNYVADGSLQNVFRINEDGTVFIGPNDESLELVRLINELAEAITLMTIPTMAGPQKPVNLPDFVDIFARLQTLIAPMPQE